MRPIVRISWLFLLAIPSVATSQKSAARDSSPTTVKKCIQYVVVPALRRAQALSSEEYQKRSGLPYDRDREIKAFKRDRQREDSAARVAALTCAGKFSLKNTASEDLPALIELHLYAQQISKAAAVVEHRLAKAATPTKKTTILWEAIGSFRSSSEAAEARREYREKFLSQLDALGDVALAERVNRRVQMYDGWADDSAEKRISHLRDAIKLSAQITDSATRAKIVGMAPYAYVLLAQEAQDRADLAYAEAIADSGMMLWGNYAGGKVFQLPGYGMLGDKGSAVESSHWFNAPEGFKQYAPGNGRVTLIELTSYG